MSRPGRRLRELRCAGKFWAGQGRYPIATSMKAAVCVLQDPTYNCRSIDKTDKTGFVSFMGADIARF